MRTLLSHSLLSSDLPPAWSKRLAPEEKKPYFQELTEFLNREYQSGAEIFPPRGLVLRALQKVDYDQVRVVILGQDPYHGPGQAIGLSFGVPNHLKPKPPSLGNIFKELASDLGQTPQPDASDLTGWAEQGVLLLNTALTVRRAQAFSHSKKGWETFTDQVIRSLNERKKPVIFILWGASAIAKKKLISHPQHRIIESPHPSPLSAYRGFFGSKPFSKANALLEELHQTPIDWMKISAESHS